MQRLSRSSLSAALCDGVAALAFPPPSYALVPDAWNGGAPITTPVRVDSNDDGGRAWATAGAVIPEVDVELWADAARALTAAELFAGGQHAFTFADLTVTAVPQPKASLDLATKTTHCDTVIEALVAGKGGNAFTIAFAAGSLVNAGALTKVGNAYTFAFKTAVTTVANFEAAIAASADLAVKTPGTGATALVVVADEFGATALAGGDDSKLHSVAHGLLTGDGPVDVTATGSIPAGLVAATDYYAIKDGADNFGLATSLANALAGTRVQFTDAGAGTIKTVVSPSRTQRVHWMSHGLLGPLGDGAITLDAQRSYWKTVPHRARTVAYAVIATFGAGAGVVSGAVYPTVDAG